MTRLVNLTLHPVTVFADGVRPEAWPTSGRFARREEVSVDAGTLATDRGLVPLRSVVYTGRIEELPPAVDGVAYLVSRVLAEAVPRDDLLFPVDEVRDADGRIIGCRALGRFVHGAGGSDAD